MLNSIDSFFQYLLNDCLSSFVFFSKKNALHNVKIEMLFFIMSLLNGNSLSGLFFQSQKPWFEICLNREKLFP